MERIIKHFRYLENFTEIDFMETPCGKFIIKH